MKNKILLIAGPCAVENDTQVKRVCKCLSSLGLSWIRGGAFKPRVSPHSFQGLGDKALNILFENAKRYNLKTITEVVDEQSLKLAIKKVNGIQIGTRNMSNFSLLKKVGEACAKEDKLVLFKRGMSAKISEWLSASEYIKAAGSRNIMLCERGIRTFEDATRFTLDISAVPVIHKQSRYPICVDVSHAAGNSSYIESLSMAAIASGADALMLEVHPSPKNAKSDGPQQLDLENFVKLYNKLNKLALSLGKELV